MSKGPHIFDNELAELDEKVEWGLVEVEQGESDERTDIVAVAMIPRSRKALVVQTGFEGDDAWASVHKIDTRTGDREEAEIVLDDGDQDSVIARRTDVR